MLHAPALETKQRRGAKSIPLLDGPSREHQPAAQQRTFGNQAVLRVLQRKCACGGAGGPCTECEEKNESSLQRSAAGPGSIQTAPPIVHDVLRSPGRPLDTDTRAFMETRLGQPFGAVRVHTDSEAAASARVVNAQAYTVGSHIVFAGGYYAPSTLAGRRTLAHELAHVIQQAGSPAQGSLDRLTVSDPDDSYEREAEHTAERVISGEPPAQAYSAGHAMLQRQIELTCSLDPFELAKLLKGDKSVALKFLNCCESGLGPLPSGCTKDLVEAAEKLLGKKKDKKETCPSGFHAGTGTDRAGLCCQDGTTDKKDCCTADRIPSKAFFPKCCPEGQVVDKTATKCVAPPAPPPTPEIPVCPPDKPSALLSCICPPERQNKEAGLCCPVGEEGSTGECKKPTPAPPPKPATPVPSAPIEIYFNLDRPRIGESGSSGLAGSLTSKGKKNLDDLKSQLSKNPDWKVQLVGRASPEGTDDYNMKLGSRRAQMIAQALVDAGIDRSRIVPAPSGGPAAPCETVDSGLFTCGKSGSSGASDRQVRAEIFTK